MYKPAFGIHADMGLHAEIPLVALLCLAHIRVAPGLSVLGRGRCRNPPSHIDAVGGRLHHLKPWERENVTRAPDFFFLEPYFEGREAALMPSKLDPLDAARCAEWQRFGIVHSRLVEIAVKVKVAQGICCGRAKVPAAGHRPR